MKHKTLTNYTFKYIDKVEQLQIIIDIYGKYFIL